MFRSPVFVAVSLVCCVGALAPAALADEAPKREYIVDDRLPPASTQWKTVVGGLGAAVAFYAAAQPFSYIWPDSPGATYLRYPVVGPWMTLGSNKCAPDDSCSTVWLVVRGIFEVLDGLGQAGGLAVALEGILMPTDRQTNAAPRKPPPRKPAPTPEPSGTQPGNLFYIPRPMVVGQQGIGLGIGGLF